MWRYLHRLSFVLYLAWMMASCHTGDSREETRHSNKTEHGLDHEEDDEALIQSVLLFVDGYELFAEFHALVAGENVVFITHITHLADYKPVRSGRLTLMLKNEQNEFKTAVDQPEVPGIFEPVLRPDIPGIYRLIVELQQNERRVQFIINDITVFADEISARNVLREKPEDVNRITFLKEQAWKTDFALEEIHPRRFREVIPTSGQIMPANGDETTIVAPFSGIVFLERMLVAGREVENGERLLSLSGKGLAVDNISVHYTALRTEYEETKSNFNRLQKLIDDKLVSQQEFLKAKTAYENARAAYENISEPVEGMKTPVRTSLGGFIKDVLVEEGQYVSAGDPLVTVSQNKRLLIRADVSQNHWHCLPDVTEANFITPYNSKLYNTSELNGKLVSYSRNAANSAWSAPVYFEVNNTGNLIPGTYIEVYLMTRFIPNVIAIPESAIVEEQGNFFVFIQKEGESYEKRAIKTGVRNGKEIEVVSGLKDGEYLVTQGVYQLKLASLSGSLPAHNHDH